MVMVSPTDIVLGHLAEQIEALHIDSMIELIWKTIWI
jgi:hypothetical protein